MRANGWIDAQAPFDLFSARRVDCVDHGLLVSELHVQSAQLQAVVPALSGRFLTARSCVMQIPGTVPAPRLYEPAAAGTPEATEFVPDGVLLLRHVDAGKALLFFVEVDMGSQPLRSPTSGVAIDTKIRRYRSLFVSGGHRRYEALAGCPLRGFRLLFVCGSLTRLAQLLPLARQSGPCDFVWGTDQGRLVRDGIWGSIWHRAPFDGPQAESILGGMAPARFPPPEGVHASRHSTTLRVPPVSAGPAKEPSTS